MGSRSARYRASRARREESSHFRRRTRIHGELEAMAEADAWNEHMADALTASMLADFDEQLGEL